MFREAMGSLWWPVLATGLGFGPEGPEGPFQRLPKTTKPLPRLGLLGPEGPKGPKGPSRGCLRLLSPFGG